MDIDTIIFDLDGTLWNPLCGVVRAWQNVLARYPKLRGPISEQEIAAYLGCNTEDIAAQLFSDADLKLRSRLMRECSREEKDLLAKAGGDLFPGVEETIAYLSPRYRLAIVSNCDCGYIECFLAAHHLQPYFQDFECYGNTGRSKGENIREVMRRLGSRGAIYIGDMILDQEAAAQAHIPFVFAAYGFGGASWQPSTWDYAIASFPELIKILEK
jgi:phosphoglycolate phosphatase